MAVIVVLLVCVITVFGESAEVKRQTACVLDPLISKYAQQELLLKSIEKIMVEKFSEMQADHKQIVTELKGDIKSLANQIIVSDRKVETIKNEMSQLVASFDEFKNNQTHACCERITDKPLITTTTGPQVTQKTSITTTTKPCPTGYGKNAHGCYKLVLQDANWDTAVSTCRAEGAHLVTLESSEKLQALGEWMKRQGAPVNNWYRVGGRKLNGRWTWVYGDTPFTFTNWRPSRPDGRGECAEMDYGPGRSNHLEWFDASCTGNYAYTICEL